MPAITVIICTYNRGNILGETLESFDAMARVTAVSMELLIVNNNSSDATARIAQGFVAVNTYARYIFEPTPGLSELGLDDSIPIVATVGGLRPVKDQATFLRAASLLKGCAVFLVIGEGAERPRLEHFVKELGMVKFVYFLGARKDIHLLIAGADILVVSSISESFSLSAIEAMACGVAVICTRCGGPEEIVVDGVTGALVDIGATESMAAAMKRILFTPGMVEEYGKAGREHALSHFDEHGYIAHSITHNS